MGNPIKSQKEAENTRRYLINTTSSTLKISNEEAEKRVDALFKSGILDQNLPMPIFQMQVDAFLSIDSSKYNHIAD
jgi:hypothetical protein